MGRARNGLEAVERTKAWTPDVIVMDIAMPLMDGIEATHRIRAVDSTVGIVIFTGSDEARDEQRAREVGANAFVRKTHIDALLLDAINRAARRDGPGTRSSSPHLKLEAVIAVP